ncbi:MAG TPA: MetQ/NlpA family ABC transporter substrate-binding protein [Calditerricola sp.]
MRKALTLLMLALLVVLPLAGCGTATEKGGDTSQGAANNKPLKVGATAVPHAEILNEVVKPKLKEKGIDLEVVVFQDYVLPNTQLAEGALDANYFQHIKWLEATNKEKGYKLVPVAGVHIEPLGLYPNKQKGYKSVNDLPDGATIAITNGASEWLRVFRLLEAAGLIKLKDGVGEKVTEKDIVDNPKRIKFTQVDPAMLPRTLEDPKIDAAVINTNFAIEGGLVPIKDAIFREDETSPYVNVLVTREDNKNDPRIQELVNVLLSEDVKKYIEEKYKGAVLPAQKTF